MSATTKGYLVIQVIIKTIVTYFINEYLIQVNELDSDEVLTYVFVVVDLRFNLNLQQHQEDLILVGFIVLIGVDLIADQELVGLIIEKEELNGLIMEELSFIGSIGFIEEEQDFIGFISSIGSIGFIDDQELIGLIRAIQ